MDNLTLVIYGLMENLTLIRWSSEEAHSYLWKNANFTKSSSENQEQILPTARPKSVPPTANWHYILGSDCEIIRYLKKTDKHKVIKRKNGK